MANIQTFHLMRNNAFRDKFNELCSPDPLHRRHEPGQSHVPGVGDHLLPLGVHDRLLHQGDVALDGGEEALAPRGKTVSLGQEATAGKEYRQLLRT